MSKSNEYGYIQDGPTQASGSNSGVFEVNDVVDLLNQSKWTLQTFSLSYLVIAGGGGGGNNFGSGGGAGGYRNSYASETSGGNSSTETPITITPGDTYTVTVGAGGGGLASGSNSVFSTITSIGGGRGVGSSGTAAGGGSGGGGPQNGGTAGAGTSGQGFAGLDGGGNTAGGGAGGGQSRSGGSGVVILRYPAGNTITVGSGLTSSTSTDGSDKVTTFTAGTDTISFA